MNRKRWFAGILMVTMILTVGCQSKKSDVTTTSSVVNTDAPVTLKWYIPCATQEDNNLIYQEANKIIKEKLNAEVEFSSIDFGSYAQKMQVINAGREVYDICYTSNWLNNYYQNVEKGNIMALDELLPKYAPELYAQINSKYWDGVKVQGKIYGVINQQIFARESGWIIPEVFVEKYGIDMNKLESLDDIENVMKTVQKDNPTCVNVGGFWTQYAQMKGIEEFLGESAPSAIYYKRDGKPKVFNQYLSDEFKTYIDVRKRWNEAGYTQKVALKAENAVQQYKNDKITSPLAALATYKPGVEDEIVSQTKVRPVVKRVGGPLLTTYGVTATLNSISSTSKNPERATMLLNLINTNKELYNLLSFGIEGRHYTKIADNKIELNKDNRYIAANWAIGSVYNSYLFGNQSDDVWEQTKKINDSATISPVYQFAPNLTPVNVQLSNCKTAISEYLYLLDQGIGNKEEQYAKLLQKLENAGVNQVIAEMQKQIDAWYSTK